jgi:hypothetical protein
LRKLEAQLPDTVEVVTLDFRGLPNSTLQHGILIANALLDEKPIGQVESTSGIRTITAEPGTLFGDRKLVIVIDGRTQGTALWIAAAVADAEAGGVVFGKSSSSGLVHEGVPLENADFVVHMPTVRLRRIDGSLLIPLEENMGTSIQGLTVIRQPTIIGRLLQQPKLGNIEVEPMLQQGSTQSIANTIAHWYEQLPTTPDEPKE